MDKKMRSIEIVMNNGKSLQLTSQMTDAEVLSLDDAIVDRPVLTIIGTATTFIKCDQIAVIVVK